MAQIIKFKVILKNSELLYMKTSSPALIFTILALFTVNCVEKGPVTTSPPGSGGVTPPHPTKESFVYGSEFDTKDGTAYQALLEACNRCGKKWFSPTSWGGRTYNKCAPLSSNSPLYCKNWTSRGYLQVKFAEKKFPTTAIVTIWPLYTYRSQEQWGQSFEGRGKVEPINENKGFHILVTDLKARTFSVQSKTTNHVNGGTLNVEVHSGGTIMLSAEQMPRIKDANPPARYPCGQRPPDLLHSGQTNAFCFNIGF